MSKKFNDYLSKVMEDLSLELTPTGETGKMDGETIMGVTKDQVVAALKASPALNKAIEAEGGIEKFMAADNVVDFLIDNSAGPQGRNVTVTPDNPKAAPVKAIIPEVEYQALKAALLPKTKQKERTPIKPAAPVAQPAGQTTTPVTPAPGVVQ